MNAASERVQVRVMDVPPSLHIYASRSKNQAQSRYVQALEESLLKLLKVRRANETE